MTAVTPRTQAAERILEDARRTGEAVTALHPLLESFAPLLAARADLRVEAPGWSGELPVFDPDRFCNGAPILAECGFQDVSPLLAQAAEVLLPLMREIFPGLSGQLLTLAQALTSGLLSPEELLAAGLNGAPVRLDGLDAEVLNFAAWEMAKPFIERQAEDLSALIRDLPWRQNCCPVCGGLPNLSRLISLHNDDEFITAHGGPRMLRCATCSTQWRHKRVSCPRCGNEEPSRLIHMHTQTRPYERVDVCDDCKTYMLCLDTTELIAVPDPDISALAMFPLELRARKAGYVPLATHPWSAGAGI